MDVLYTGSSLGLLSVAKATRLLRLRRFWSLFAGQGVKLASAAAMLRLFLTILLSCHLLACFWYDLAEVDHSVVLGAWIWGVYSTSDNTTITCFWFTTALVGVGCY